MGGKLLAFNYRTIFWTEEERQALQQSLVVDHYLKQFNDETITPRQQFTCGEPCAAVCKKIRITSYNVCYTKLLRIVFSNNLLWLYFFWEITTVCSFLLIGYKDDKASRESAFRALNMNLLGGVVV